MTSPDSPPRETEFSALRDSIQKMIDREGALESLTILIAGSLFAASHPLPIATFVYPLLGVFLAARWAVIAVEINDTGQYIWQQYEGGMYGQVGWEHYVRTLQRKHGFVTNILGLSSGGLFVGTELVAIIWSLFTFIPAPDPGHGLLLGADVLALVFTVISLWQVALHQKRLGRVEIPALRPGSRLLHPPRQRRQSETAGSVAASTAGKLPRETPQTIQSRIPKGDSGAHSR